MGLPRHCFSWVFQREFSGLLKIEDKNKVVVVGPRLQEKEFRGIQGGC